MLPPIQEASPAYLHGSNNKEENNLSSKQEKLFSSFLVSKVSSQKHSPLTRRRSPRSSRPSLFRHQPPAIASGTVSRAPCSSRGSILASLFNLQLCCRPFKKPLPHTYMEASSKAARANLLHRHPQLKLQVGAPELASRFTRRSSEESSISTLSSSQGSGSIF